MSDERNHHRWTDQWQSQWDELELAPAPTHDSTTFRNEVMARIRAHAQPVHDRVEWRSSPLWVRALAPLALMIGLATGVTLSTSDNRFDNPEGTIEQPISLAESYWLTLEIPEDPDSGDRSPDEALPTAEKERAL